MSRFNEQGFLSPLEVLNPSEADQARSYFDGLFEELRRRDDGRNSYAILGYQARCRGIWELARHPRILDRIEALLGPDFVCWSTHFFCKLPEDSRPVPWHQDASYWPIRPTKTVTAWLAIDDVDAENAPMRFLAGSHRQGRLPWRRAGETAILHQEIPQAHRLGVPVDNVLRAGQISIHSGTIVHGSEVNRSRRRRCGLALRYVPSSCDVLIDDARHLLESAVPGRGDTGRWRRNQPPSGDDLSMVHHFYCD
ncbi:MAG: phytanoyl-CoA dioxygenase family protein [Candidatus Binatia bacterium]|nr:phytanoyl-CoA dioxygenase family protein [Candidatus Binatia bacterium]